MKVNRPADFICDHPMKLAGVIILFFTVIVATAMAVIFY